MKKIIIIPTYNEKENILTLYNKINKNIKSDILYVDDNSKDGSQEIIKQIAGENKNVHYIFRGNKFGIGSAHKDAIKWAYKKKYNIIISMDGDGTHDPKYLKQIVDALFGNDIVSTNRFLKKDSLSDWPRQRVILTKLRHILISFVLGISYDSSGAFRCINTSKVLLKDLLAAKANDYAYFWQSIFILHKKNYSICEIPINLPYRKLGSSKMRLLHIFNSLIYLFFFFFRRIFSK